MGSGWMISTKQQRRQLAGGGSDEDMMFYVVVAARVCNIYVVKSSYACTWGTCTYYGMVGTYPKRCSR